MSINASIVWKSNLQKALTSLKQGKNEKAQEILKEFERYVLSGGSLDDCFTVLLQILDETTFASFKKDGRPEDVDVITCDTSSSVLLTILKSNECKSSGALKVFDKDVIRRILRAFQYHCSTMQRTSETIKRKNQWKAILRETYSNFYSHREFLYDTIIEYFVYLSNLSKSNQPNIPGIALNFMQQPETKVLEGFIGVADLLEVVGAIIQGFDCPLKKKHTQKLLQTGLMPLHDNILPFHELQCLLSVYHRQLSFCVLEFIKKDDLLLTQIINRLCSLLPKLIKGGYSKPAVFLINEVEELLKLLPLEDFNKVKTSFFNVLQLSIESLHYAIAQRSLLLLNTPTVSNLCDSVYDYFSQTIIPILLRVCQNHWNDSTKQMSFQVLLSNSTNPKSRLLNNYNFKTIKESYTERWQSDADSEKLKQKRMLEIKDDLSFTKIVFVNQLGEGSYSQVHHIRRIDHSVSQLYWEDYAMKVMENHQLIEQEYMENAKREIDLLKNYFRNHPNIIKLIGQFEENDKIYLVLEFCERGDLFSVLERLGTVNIEYAKFTLSQVCNALKAIHRNGVAHLDIKPENILISKSGFMKVTDFGSAIFYKDISSDDNYRLQGTAEYLSPKLIAGNNPDPTDDVWAIGCLLYQLLAGTTPFNATNKDELFNKISSRKLFFPTTFPEVAKDLVSKIFCLDRDEYVPMSLLKVMKHEFFNGIDWQHLNDCKPPIPEEGSIKVADIDMDLRQRKASMLITQSLPKQYQYSSFSLEPIPETPEDLDCEAMYD